MLGDWKFIMVFFMIGLSSILIGIRGGAGGAAPPPPQIFQMPIHVFGEI